MGPLQSYWLVFIFSSSSKLSQKEKKKRKKKNLRDLQANSSFRSGLKQERSILQAPESGLRGRSPGRPEVSEVAWWLLWEVQEKGRSDRSWGHVIRLPLLVDKFHISFAMRGEGQARLALSSFLLARTTKDQFHPRELLSSEGLQLIPGEAIVSS